MYASSAGSMHDGAIPPSELAKSNYQLSIRIGKFETKWEVHYIKTLPSILRPVYDQIILVIVLKDRVI
ncbi:hypothetical protein Lfee_0094 [Legionella feeleii]|uniref:Uncharacterized protein n=1 Tax=Legionella feeleii TaxID=453 RepID=A0A0W0UAJ5_9GAMM|nr:hypothetical protein Lfee_0094 [Legionella feeleii]SPX59826.1 Uncharacterised protein [Legionella feeleii]